MPATGAFFRETVTEFASNLGLGPANDARLPSPAAETPHPAVTGNAARALLALIRLYQRFVSPALPVLTLGQCACRFSPTCSHYAAAAIQTHGAIAGFRLAAIRLAKCTPLHRGGFDPVPSRAQTRTPRCNAVSPAAHASNPIFHG